MYKQSKLFFSAITVCKHYIHVPYSGFFKGGIFSRIQTATIFHSKIFTNALDRCFRDASIEIPAGTPLIKIQCA